MSLRIADLADARVAIWGFGREGRAALVALRRYFPHKPLTLFCNEAEAALLIATSDVATPSPPTGSAERVGVSGGRRRLVDVSPVDPLPPHPTRSLDVVRGEGLPDASPLRVVTQPPDVAALEQFDVVIKSPGISPYKLPAAAALRAGVRFISGSALWFAEHPHARTICVTGTKGKSTVSALIAHVLRKSGRSVALAGNIGVPLLELIVPPLPPQWWVIELSSFQTHDFGGAPTVAVINNLYEEHLDWHGTRERYATDKLMIAANAMHVVVNAQDELLAATRAHASRSVFGTRDGWHVAADAICRGATVALALIAVPLPGLHNAQNVCAALAALDAAGLDALALAPHVTTFKSLPHRLQLLGVRDGTTYVNDSIATTPQATIEALRSIGDGAAVVLVGGFDRGLDWRPFVEHVAAHPPAGIVTMGANGPAIAAALKALDHARFALRETQSLGDALVQARSVAPRGATIVLSPGAPSFDAFHDYAERGREFARLAGFDPAAIAQIDGLGIA
jgi:UDP-N-acetylmuramoylalanine--D-glutamate ligase